MSSASNGRNFLGISWLASMLNTFFYLPAGLMFLMYYLLHDPLQQSPGLLPLNMGPLALLSASIGCLLIWTNSVLVLLLQDWLERQSQQRQWLFSMLPLLGIGVGAIMVVLMLVVFTGQNHS